MEESARLNVKRRPVYFVDIKSTCFLCLNEILPDIIGFVKTSTSEMPVKVERGRTNFHSIYKYLNIKPGKLLSSKQFGGQFAELLNNTDVSVRLCGKCEKLARNVTKLCVELDVVQLQLNYLLDKFKETLKESGEDNERMGKLRSLMETKNPLEQLQARVAESFRNETEIQCKKLKRKVKLKCYH